MKNENQKTVSVKIDEMLWRKVKVMACEQGKKLQELISEAITKSITDQIKIKD